MNHCEHLLFSLNLYSKNPQNSLLRFNIFSETETRHDILRLFFFITISPESETTDFLLLRTRYISIQSKNENQYMVLQTAHVRL